MASVLYDRMRRSTPWTRRWGAAALLSATATALLPLLRYGAPLPRRDILTAFAVALLCGLGWVVATWRAPLTGLSLAKPEADVVIPVPGKIPRTPLTALGGTLAAALAVYAVFSAQLVAMQPDGRQARTIAALQDAGARVTTATVTEVWAQEESAVSVSGGEGTPHYWYASFAATLPDGTMLSVDRGIVAGLPFRDTKVSILYAPGRLELGGWVDDSADIAVYTRSWGPPLDFQAFWTVLMGAFALTAVVIVSLWNRGGRRLLREDAAAGRVYAVRVDTLTAVRKEHVTVGSRPGTTRTVVRRSLRASTECGDLKLGVPSYDIPLLAADFGAGGGRLLFARRWRMDNADEVPGVFVAPDGRMFPFRTGSKHVERLARKDVLHPSDPSVAARYWSMSCRTSPARRLLIVALYALAAASAVPLLVGTQSYGLGWLLFLLMATAGVLGPCLAGLAPPAVEHPVWERQRTVDPRVTT
ncbi:hypothetical protein LK07_12480 [Streptomyces pluripotens]|uniref:Uncharacterized protein n=2 Tax=Streptomyces pluripotens TaxID=1355015 RepID=A0A221NY32_9ACTN|nr:hypothetical protein LK06_011355 [Streptomyces pluripotens]ASN24718.1 hypothetical protein LK07_12480 [Streptomyces pluripotens]